MKNPWLDMVGEWVVQILLKTTQWCHHYRRRHHRPDTQHGSRAAEPLLIVNDCGYTFNFPAGMHPCFIFFVLFGSMSYLAGILNGDIPSDRKLFSDFLGLKMRSTIKILESEIQNIVARKLKS